MARASLSQYTSYKRIYIYSYYADELEAESDDDPLSSLCDDALHAMRAALDNSARSAGRHRLQMRLWVHESGTDFKSVLGLVPYRQPHGVQRESAVADMPVLSAL